MRLRLYTNPEVPTGPSESPAQAAAVASAPYQVGARAIEGGLSTLARIEAQKEVQRQRENVVRAAESKQWLDVQLDTAAADIKESETFNEETGEFSYQYGGQEYKDAAEAFDQAQLDTFSQAQDRIAELDDDELRKTLQQQLQSRMAGHYSAWNERRAALKQQDHQQRMMGLASRAFEAGDIRGAREAIALGVNNGIFGKEQGKALRKNLEDAWVENHIANWRRAYETGGPDAASQYLLTVDNSDDPESLKASFRSKVSKIEKDNPDFKRMAAQADQRKQAEIVKRETAVEIATKQGQFTLEQLDEMLEAGAIGMASYKRSVKNLFSHVETAVEQARIDEGTMSALSAGMPLEMSKDNQDSIDRMYEQAKADGTVGMFIQLAGQSQMIPTEVKNRIALDLGSTDSERVAATATVYKNYRDNTPQALKHFSESAKDGWDTYLFAIESGSGPDEALKAMRANSIERPTAVTEARDAEYSAQKYTASNRDVLEDTLDDIDPEWNIGLGAEPPLAMYAEFEAAVRRKFMQMGNIEAAREAAAREISSIYAITSVGTDRRWMKYAPEAAWAGGPNLPEDWHQKQFVEAFGEDVTIMADATTLSTNGGSYAVVHPETKEFIDRWTPNIADAQRAEAARLREEASPPMGPVLFREGPALPPGAEAEALRKARKARLLERQAEQQETMSAPRL